MADLPAEGSKGFVAWIEGLPCSGKTTLSRAVADRLRAQGRKVEVLDGDEVRQMFARNDAAVLVAMITPYETSRQAARATVGGRFTEIWLKCPVEVCRQRDPKGLYRGSAALKGTKLTGVDDPFEEPLNPDLIVDTANNPVEESTRRILDHLSHVGFVPPDRTA